MAQDLVGAESAGRYVVVKALEDGVTIMGLTRGRDTRSHHSERLDAGEVMIAQFTELTAAIKVRGHAEIPPEVCHLEAVGLEQSLEALADDGLIVDDEHRGAFGARRRGRGFEATFAGIGHGFPPPIHHYRRDRNTAEQARISRRSTYQ